MSSEIEVRRSGVLVVTTEVVAGYDIIGVSGAVLGIALRTQNPYAAGFVSTRDGSACPDDVRSDLLTGCRWEAIEQMVLTAVRLGVNAVVAMRFDHRAVTGTSIEVCAYGTAVTVARPPTPRGTSIAPRLPTGVLPR